MTEAHAIQRDARTLEFRNFVEIPESGETSGYTVDHYLFFPRSLGIDGANWTESDFYRSSNGLLRLKAARLSLTQLSDLESRNNPATILLERSKQLLNPVPVSGKSLTAIAQLYGAELTDALKLELRKVERTISPGKATEHLEHSVRKITKALDTLGVVRRRLAPLATVAEDAMIRSLDFADEYASAIIDERFSRIAKKLEQQKFRKGSADGAKAALVLARTMDEVNAHRKRSGHARPGGKSREYYLYRIGLVKKELQRTLYVETRGTGKDPFVSNSAAMVAAGLAATWATIAQVPLIAGKWTTWEGVGLFTAAVVAYVLKDRIKDLVKKRLLKRWQPWDQENEIGDNIFEHVGLGKVHGRAYERVRWLSVESVPREVMQVRTAERTVSGATPDLDHVLRYTRKLRVDGTDLPTQASEFGIQAIFRFSLRDILNRMDDPYDSQEYYDEGRGAFVRGLMPKVYHLNVVTVTTNTRTETSVCERVRVVANREGILRVESFDD